MAEAYIVEAVRTPVGRRRGGLSGVHPADLGAHVLKALVARAGVDPAAVEDVLTVAQPVRAVDVDQGGVHPQRGHGDELLLPGRDGARAPDRRRPSARIRGGDRPQTRGGPHHVRTDTRPHRHERQPVRRGLQTPHEHRLVDLQQLQRTALPGRAVVRFQRDRVEGDERGDQSADAARRSEHADVRAAVRDDREVGDRGAQQCPHQGHRFAARPPAADAEGHAALQPGDHLVGGHRLVPHASSLPKASRTRAAVPPSCASNVKPCSKR